MMIAVAAILGVMASVQRGVERQVDIAERQQRARLASEALDREIRSGAAMAVTPDGQTLSLLSLSNLPQRGVDISTQPGSCAQFKVQGGKLLKRWWVPPKTPANVVHWNIVVGGVETTTGAFSLPDTIENPAPPHNLFEVGGRVVKIALTLTGQGQAVNQTIDELVRGDNVPMTTDSPCDQAGEWPSS